jgi:phospholipid N-methyltransferase
MILARPFLWPSECCRTFRRQTRLALELAMRAKSAADAHGARVHLEDLRSVAERLWLTNAAQRFPWDDTCAGRSACGCCGAAFLGNGVLLRSVLKALGRVLIGLAFGRDEEPWQDSSPRAGAACRSPRKGRMKTNVAERLIFLRAFGTHPRLVGAVVPTSRWAVVDMLDMADIQGAKSVVELGAGTGVFTQEILARLRQDARVVALERDPRLAGLLTKRFQDPRLEVKCGSAEDLKSHLDGMTVDVVVSGLPFTSLKSDVRDRILEQVMQALAPEGVALVLQYTPIIQCQLRRLFPSVKRRVSLLNVPPAFLFACSMRKPTGAANGGRCQ